MDISFKFDGKKFNYRVCALLIHNNKILTVSDERASYSYLPGGRVQFGESSDEAIVRELKEELNLDAKVIKPLWLNQAFFNEVTSGLKFHELCMYYQVVVDKDLLDRGEEFTVYEGGHTHKFKWIAFKDLETAYFYPLFLKKEIYNLPESLTLLIENQ